MPPWRLSPSTCCAGQPSEAQLATNSVQTERCWVSGHAHKVMCVGLGASDPAVCCTWSRPAASHVLDGAAAGRRRLQAASAGGHCPACTPVGCVRLQGQHRHICKCVMFRFGFFWQHQAKAKAGPRALPMRLGSAARGSTLYHSSSDRALSCTTDDKRHSQPCMQGSQHHSGTRARLLVDASEACPHPWIPPLLYSLMAAADCTGQN